MLGRRRTVEFVRVVEDAGVDYIAVHGRRRTQRSSEPVNLEGIKLVSETATVPVIANGDAFTLDDVHRIASETGVNGRISIASFSDVHLPVWLTVQGVMAARGLLENPAMFAGKTSTPPVAVERFVAHAVQSPLPYALVLYHVTEMTRRVLSKPERIAMMQKTTTMLDLIDWVDSSFRQHGT